MNTVLDQPLSQLVGDNYKAAFVLEKYGFNFCCKGKQTLQAACMDKGLSPEKVLSELDDAARAVTTTNELTSLPLPLLVDHIVAVHHNFIRETLPLVLSQLYKVATKHGDKFPYMKKVYVLFAQVNTELLHHIDKEETSLFPLIRSIEAGDNSGHNHSAIAKMIGEIEEAHEQVGSLMQRIRDITNGYETPLNACIKFRVALNALKHFESDLQQHEHIENNILFPQATLMSN